MTSPARVVFSRTKVKVEEIKGVHKANEKRELVQVGKRQKKKIMFLHNFLYSFSLRQAILS